MGHSHGLSVEEQRKEDIKVGVKGFWILLLVTFAEVAIALFLKDLLPGLVVRLFMIALSLYKAYYIVSIFMHLGSEVGGMAATIVLPMALLIWAVIAFLWEGNYARTNRNAVMDARPGAETPAKETSKETSMRSIDDLPTQLSFQS
ncbi:cytochrome C oxidase subunit IV family protein [Aureispira sp. CCB-E]|uniref:cytochrome C oxidase subunit IV family protein n=1 Tax=Aureispira sp. CCB-E TaxID=3051121 RepID=UPI0028684950|nr:cytochrome C oxidase subunit IV family protein [Aureispira sp. CCB-E]WMX15664.1 cytochrome C oxidase subunit IV family protein [Aureispira sp. CCB-E]